MLTSLVVLVVVLAAATDVWRGRIYNWLTYPALVAGLVLQMATRGPLEGAVVSLLGVAAVGVPALLLFATGGFGGGDVKLLAALGAFVGAVPALETFVLSLGFGLVVAGALLAWQGRFFAVVLRRDKGRLEVPFGAAIALGALAMLWERSGGLTRGPGW